MTNYTDDEMAEKFCLALGMDPDEALVFYRPENDACLCLCAEGDVYWVAEDADWLPRQLVTSPKHLEQSGLSYVKEL